MIAADRSKYLKFLLTDPRHCGVNFLYTATDALLTLEAEVVKQEEPTIDREERTQKQTERLPVLEMLRKYGLGEQRKHLLLAGKPGSGKSTTLWRLCVELAEIALADESHPIPVFVQLKGNKPILELIADQLENGDLDLEPKEIKQLLRQQKLVLLLDGVNEIPSEQLRRDLQDFRENNLTTPTIFTARDLTVGGSLGIDKRLEMRPLTEEQMREFVHKYLPEYGDKLLGKLRDQLREIAETPLLLKMLCEVFEPVTGRIPQNKAELFELFDRKYQRHKEGVAISADFRRFQSEILQYLAFTMLQGDAQKPTEAWLTLSRSRAEVMIEAWLKHRGETDPASKAKEWLEDLVEHHLLQVAADPQHIEFHHQLFQEYYAARYLRSMLQDNDPDLVDDERLKNFYLNYLKWTEPLGLLLGLLDDESQALRLVGLGLEVDWFLGARLAGEVKEVFQGQTVGLVDRLIEEKNLSNLLKLYLWEKTRSSVVIPNLLKLLEDEDFEFRWKVIDTISQLGDRADINALLAFLQDPDSWLKEYAERAIRQLDSRHEALPPLKDIESDIEVRMVDETSQLDEEEINLADLLLLVEDSNSDSNSRHMAVDKILRSNDINYISKLLPLIHDLNYVVKSSLMKTVAKLGDETHVYHLLPYLHDLEPIVKKDAIDAVYELANPDHLHVLLPFLKDVNYSAREGIIHIIRKIGDSSIIPDLQPLLHDRNSSIRLWAEVAIGEFSHNMDISKFEPFLKDPSPHVRTNAVLVISHFGGTNSVDILIPLLQDKEERVRASVAREIASNIDQKYLPYLHQKLAESPDTKILRLILTIQTRCQFYNYDISLSPPPSMQPLPTESPSYIGTVGILNTGSVNLQNQIGIQQPEQPK
jgi:HEAT repeat protein